MKVEEFKLLDFSAHLNFTDHHKGLRAVAILEACKGLIVLIAGMILLFSFRENAGVSATHLIEYLHLNPTGNYAGRFIRAMSQVEGSQLGLFAGLVLVYSIVRFIEAYGLWRQRRWAKWFAALGGAIYIPIELYELYHRPSWLTVVALFLNIGIVAYMIWILQESKSRSTTN